ncbi:hypothetical protein M3J09_013831 [Ascochyta lentis]
MANNSSNITPTRTDRSLAGKKVFTDMKQDVKALLSKHAQKIHAKLHATADKKAKDSSKDLCQQLKDTQKELEDTQKELEDTRKELEDTRKELEETKKTQNVCAELQATADENAGDELAEQSQQLQQAQPNAGREPERAEQGAPGPFKMLKQRCIVILAILTFLVVVLAFAVSEYDYDDLFDPVVEVLECLFGS